MSLRKENGLGDGEGFRMLLGLPFILRLYIEGGGACGLLPPSCVGRIATNLSSALRCSPPFRLLSSLGLCKSRGSLIGGATVEVGVSASESISTFLSILPRKTEK